MRNPIGDAKIVHTSVLYQGSDCLGVRYTRPRNRTGIGIVFPRERFDSKKRLTPAIGSVHQGGLIA